MTILLEYLSAGMATWVLAFCSNALWVGFKSIIGGW